MKIRYGYVLTTILALAIALIVGYGTKIPSKSQEIENPMLAVLCMGDRSVYGIEINKLRLVHKIKLRSLSLDFTAGNDGKVFTSQCGLAGRDADDVIGVVDIAKGSIERYVRLKNPNPNDIAYQDGKIVVINGIMLKNGNLTGEIIEPNNDFESTSIEIPGTAHGPSLALFKGKLYLTSLINSNPGNPAYTLRPEVFSIDLNTKRTNKIFSDVFFTSIAFDEKKGVGYGLCSRGTGRNNSIYSSPADEVVVFDPEKKVVIKRIKLESQSMPADSIVWYKDKLYINFFNDTDLSYTGDSIGVLDLSTEKMKVIDGFKGPSAVLPVDDKLFVANNDTGIIDALDLNTGKRISSIKVGKWPLDLVYLKN